MKIIDAHLHFSDIETFKKTASNLSHVDYSSFGLENEFKAGAILLGIGMGIEESKKGLFPDGLAMNPMKLNLEQEIPQQLVYCLGINPERLKGEDREHQLKAIENQLKNKKVVGLKLYAGYYYYYVYDAIYDPIYDLAEAYHLPIVIHCGDTYSDRGLLKYAHPLTIDELAVRHRNINFIIAHFGDPWIMDAAEVIAKNPNVYTDLSGFIVGDSTEVNRFNSMALFVDGIKQGLIFADNYTKILYGSDWPLVAMKPYIEFIKGLIPEAFHRQVFYENALKVFPRLKEFLEEKEKDIYNTL